MIWLSWRQMRTSVAITGVALLVAALSWVTTRPHQDSVTGHVIGGNTLVQLLNTGLIALPVAIGAFWGAPLVARELESGTWRLAWTQSVSRTRWMTAKIGVVGLVAVCITSLATLGVDWWSTALDAVNTNRFATGMFSERGVAPIGYTLFALALGVLCGLVLRRTVAAVATTMAVFTAVRIVVALYLRPHYMHPLTARTQLSSSVTNTGGWVLSRTTYQPASRFWTFQWIETGLFTALAAALITVSYWWLRRRIT